MEMKEYLMNTFAFNDYANKLVLEKIRLLPDKTGAIKFFSHLINSQYKWMARILQDNKAPGMSWWEPVYSLDQLAREWKKSLDLWMDYLRNHAEEELFRELEFTGFDGARWAATAADIALQLNYHSIHHRAQIQTLIRAQGLEPDFIDYIGTRYRKLEG